MRVVCFEIQQETFFKKSQNLLMNLQNLCHFLDEKERFCQSPNLYSTIHANDEELRIALN